MRKHEQILSKLNPIFNQLDTDNKGLIGPMELIQALSQLFPHINQSEVEKLVKTFDTDFDSQLDSRDFIRLVTQGSKEATKQQIVTEMFDMIDRDNDGLINTEDLTELMQLLGEEMSPEELGTVLQIFDVSGDGNIDLAEFSSVLIEDVFKKAFLF